MKNLELPRQHFKKIGLILGTNGMKIPVGIILNTLIQISGCTNTIHGFHLLL